MWSAIEELRTNLNGPILFSIANDSMRVVDAFLPTVFPITDHGTGDRDAAAEAAAAANAHTRIDANVRDKLVSWFDLHVLTVPSSSSTLWSTLSGLSAARLVSALNGVSRSDGRTDGPTDGRTDGVSCSKRCSALHVMATMKNIWCHHRTLSSRVLV